MQDKKHFKDKQILHIFKIKASSPFKIIVYKQPNLRQFVYIYPNNITDETH